MNDKPTATDTAETTSNDLADAVRKSPPPSPKPPKGPNILLIALAGGAIVLGFALGNSWGPTVSSGVKQVLPSFLRTGQTENESASDETEGSGDADYYTCGMHPWVVLPEPGECPICHMELTPLDPAKFSGEISIDPVVSQNIGVRVEPVTSGPVVREIRTIGTVAYDETRVRDINIKVPGWIEKLYVDYEGVEVKSEDPLFEFYSPKLYSAQSEYLTSLKLRGQVGVDFLPETLIDAERLIEDARTQLEFYDITPEQIEALEAKNDPSKTMTIRSPYNGVVISKHANEGMRIDPGMRVYQIADLSKVWVMVTLYEYQLPFVQLEQHAIMKLPYIPGQTFEGRVIYIYPYLDEKSRQVQVRLEFENASGILKPGMFANIELQSTLARDRTIAPRSAVIDTGERQVAFVSLGEGKFEPRDVVMGVETAGGFVEIIDGLTPGEMVVTSGQFLLDSESRIRESLAKMIRGDLASDQISVANIEGASELVSLPSAVSEGISSVLLKYFEIGDLLSRDQVDGIAGPALGVADAVDKLLEIEIPESPHFWHQHDEIAIVRGKAFELEGDLDLESARLAFADLSVALAKLVRATGIPPEFEDEVQQLHCPMFRGGQGGSTWLQTAGDVRNPFFGTVMLECFDQRTAIPVTGNGETVPVDETSQDVSSVGAEQVAPSSAEAQDEVDAVVSAYLAIQQSLSEDNLETAGKNLMALHKALSGMSAYSDHAAAEITSQLHKVGNLDRSDLKSFRQGFRALSDTMIEFVRVAPPSQGVTSAVYHMYCPMKKADWLQVSKEVSNPYSTSMSGCGSIQEQFDAIRVAGETP